MRVRGRALPSARRASLAVAARAPIHAVAPGLAVVGPAIAAKAATARRRRRRSVKCDPRLWSPVAALHASVADEKLPHVGVPDENATVCSSQ